MTNDRLFGLLHKIADLAGNVGAVWRVVAGDF